MSWTTDRLAKASAHVLGLAKRLRVEVHWEPRPEQWQAHDSTRQVWVPPPTDAHRYMVALHELGHVASRVARRWGDRYEEPGAQALVEGAAWAWAAMVADPDLVAEATEEEWADVARHFGTYLWSTAVEPSDGKSRVRL